MAKKRELEQGKISMDKVLQMLVDEYANALDDERIYKPMSYALYQVWREVDKVEEIKNEKV